MNKIHGVARYLLGLMFLVFGLNGFLHFIPMGPMPLGLAQQFTEALMASHYMVAVFLLEIVGGALLLANLRVPLALTLLGPVVVNICLFHVTMAPQGLPPAITALVLWLVTAYPLRSVFLNVASAPSRLG